MLPLPGSVPQLLWLALIAGVCGGLAAIERKGAVQLMLSRPLVLAPALGWALGDAEGGLFLGLPLELLFLGGVNLGGSLPHNETLLTGAVVALAVPAGLASGTGVDPSIAALSLAVLFPLASAGRWLERISETWNGALAEEALQRAAAGDPSAARLQLRGLLPVFAGAALICAAAALASPLLAAARMHAPARLQLGLDGAWHAVWAVAAATAIRSIRDARAPAIAGLAAVTAAALGYALRVVP